MSWGEALRLYRILIADPSSQIAAAVAGWQHPASRELLALYDLFDSSEYGRVGRKARPAQRPWVANERKTRGRGVTREDLQQILSRARSEAVDGDESARDAGTTLD